MMAAQARGKVPQPYQIRWTLPNGARIRRVSANYSPQVVCADHPRYFGHPKVIREGEQPASHGTCPECVKLILGGIPPLE